jgi:hypothetical protein
LKVIHPRRDQLGGPVIEVGSFGTAATGTVPITTGVVAFRGFTAIVATVPATAKNRSSTETDLGKRALHSHRGGATTMIFNVTSCSGSQKLMNR